MNQTTLTPSRSQCVDRYRALLQGTRDLVGEPVLADLIAHLSPNEKSESSCAVAEESMRMLDRLGWTDGPSTPPERILQEMAKQVGRPAVLLASLLQIMSAGLYGAAPHGICEEVPHCEACSLTRHCAFFNRPGKSRTPSRRELITALSRHGANELTTEHLLALLLSGKGRFQNWLGTASTLLGHYESLRGLSRAGLLELTRYALMDESAGARVVSALELGRRMEREERKKSPQMRCGKDFYSQYHLRVRDLRQEIFLVILLDQKNRILTEEEVSRGSLTATLIHPREVFAPAIRSAAAAVALLHNHPSGDPTPSKEDRAMTCRLQEAAEILGIRLLDHVVVGEGRFVSFVDEGWM